MYIDRGQLRTLQISTAILTQGVEKLNCGKVGRPFVFSNACFAAAFLFRNATNIRYRQLQGMAEAMVGRENAPTYSAFQKGVCHSEMGHYEAALDSFSRAAGLDPENPEAHFQKGVCHSEVGNYDEAIGSFDKSILLDPKNPRAHFQKGISFPRIDSMRNPT